MTTTDRPPAPVLPRLPGQRAALALSALVGAAAAGGAVLVHGPGAEASGALVGAAIVAGFFLLGSLTTGFVAQHAPRLSLVVALLTYSLQVLLLAVVLVAVNGSESAQEALDQQWLGMTVLAGTLAWTAALVTAAAREGSR